jgi:hypothetical protein
MRGERTDQQPAGIAGAQRAVEDGAQVGTQARQGRGVRDAGQ